MWGLQGLWKLPPVRNVLKQSGKPIKGCPFSVAVFPWISQWNCPLIQWRVPIKGCRQTGWAWGFWLSKMLTDKSSTKGQRILLTLRVEEISLFPVTTYVQALQRWPPTFSWNFLDAFFIMCLLATFFLTHQCLRWLCLSLVLLILCSGLFTSLSSWTLSTTSSQDCWWQSPCPVLPISVKGLCDITNARTALIILSRKMFRCKMARLQVLEPVRDKPS